MRNLFWKVSEHYPGMCLKELDMNIKIHFQSTCWIWHAVSENRNICQSAECLLSMLQSSEDGLLLIHLELLAFWNSLIFNFPKKNNKENTALWQMNVSVVMLDVTKTRTQVDSLDGTSCSLWTTHINTVITLNTQSYDQVLSTGYNTGLLALLLRPFSKLLLIVKTYYPL